MYTFLIIFFAKYVVYIIMLIAIVYLVLLKDKNIRKKFLLLAIPTLVVSFIISRLASMLYYSPRPFVSGHFTPLIQHAADNGFPSDHTLISMTLAVIIFMFNKKLGIITGILGLFVGISRIFAGVHSLVDIIGSFGISILAVVLVQMGIKFFIQNKNSY